MTFLEKEDKTMQASGFEEKMEQNRIQVSQVPSTEVTVHDFSPGFSAHSGGSIVAPSIIGSTVTNLNINVISTSQERVSSEPSNKDSLATQQCQHKLKAVLKMKFSHLLEGMMTKADKVPLNKIYTELYITEGGSSDVNREHEVRQIEAASRLKVVHEKSIHCNYLFDSTLVRTVITRGVAGIGKTVLTNKFTLDWAEERANFKLDFVFPLTFRELNLMRKKTLSLEQLMYVFFPETRDSGIFMGGGSKILFILDGLDESRLSLDFHSSEIVIKETEPTTVALLLTNLIRGRLLPLAFVWITTRPAASGQIPHEHVDLITEVRGFSDMQKDEYFQRRIGDKDLANRVITHVKSCRSLHIMCHIPVFCWMAATVLETKLTRKENKDTPKSLTQMYIHFLSLYVENMKKRLPGRRESNAENMRANLVSLGKLAFQELEKGHLIFYESDLTQNGINVAQASMFSGLYTQVFSEEVMLCKEKMFCFVHLSIQEFFAALYVFLIFHNDNINILVKKSSVSRRLLSRDSSEVILYKEAVEKALRCENGHFDIFLRFLLGLSLEENHSLLKHLMTSNRMNKRTRTEITKHIKERIRSSPSTERCLNLFHCLNELNDHSLVDEIQSCLRTGGLKRVQLSPAQWATLVFVLLTSEEELSVFELSNYTRSDEGLLRLLPVVKTAQVINLKACNLSAASCEILTSITSSSKLQELDLSNNKLTDTGIIRLSMGLKNCHLRTLRLRNCCMTEHSADPLSSVITLASCRLKELDLADNDLQDLGVERLSVGLGSPDCKLEILILSLCRVTEEGCTFLASALNIGCLRELDLSYNHPGSSGLKLLYTLRDDPRCSLEKLSVDECGESRMQAGPKKYTIKLTLDPNTAHKDLSLGEENRKATRWTTQPYPDHPERFDFWAQVLGAQGLTGRHYWETEWRGRAFIGVAYRRMCRKGDGEESWLGRNDVSWGLSCSKDGYRTFHKGKGSALPVSPSSNKLGVFLDWSAGTLSFFMVFCGTLTLLHTFHTTFTEPVYAGFRLGWVDSTLYLG